MLGGFKDGDANNFWDVLLKFLVDGFGNKLRAGTLAGKVRVLVEIGVVVRVGNGSEFLFDDGKVQRDVGLIQRWGFCPGFHHKVVAMGVLANALVIEQVACGTKFSFNFYFKHNDVVLSLISQNIQRVTFLLTRKNEKTMYNKFTRENTS